MLKVPIKGLDNKIGSKIPNLPPEVLKCLFRTKTFILMNRFNNQILYNFITKKQNKKTKLLQSKTRHVLRKLLSF